MTGLRRRLSALERQNGEALTHCLLWWPGCKIEDALVNSPEPKNCGQRLLIELAFVGDGPLSADQLVEQGKAHAWADELDAP